MFQEVCFICGKPTDDGSLYCSDECKFQDYVPPTSGSRSSRSTSAHDIHPITDVPALSPYAQPTDPDSDVPEHYLGESALQITPSTSPTSSLYTDDEDEEDLMERQPDARVLAKSLPHDMQNFDRQATVVGFQSYQVILSNYQRPPPRPKHPNLSVPVASQTPVNLRFHRIPARTNGFHSPPLRPHTRGKEQRSVSDRLVRSSQSSPSRRHSFPTLANLGLNLPSPQPSPQLRPTKPSRPKHSLVSRHSTSSCQQRPKLEMTVKRVDTTQHSSPETPKVVQQPRQTEAQAFAAMARARGSSGSRTRLDDDILTTPTQPRDDDRGRSRTRQPPSASRSRSRSASRSKSHLGGFTPAYDANAAEDRQGRRSTRGLLLPAFGIGALTRSKDPSAEREEFRGRKGRVF
ncbi:hypothetical protein DACRYDRAFT_113631 [Dacryopinax primogenitus]|uniref:Uncharacterized protein n=1 Tax=Dacryopinax primogenitus (strain DJM 731) TaxID=1858805 RepID=M5GGI5_DACPD|nr:uncharacterized protein DACRYDRAFT_113631 [Dacryopinax primogenitus]EJU05548.1 hypothetical protein DACRYDRAFT_113631 [Dacryopinax primogenitus]